ncbi:MAG: acetyl-CoA carboxylase biotin carboxyl carrier protein [Firmicutes bacterium]|nr:acetyl-CoA carboxylase biotin carboxyl carrier protein [[Eubacterium] siraeum]MCM1486865.1 acetyl-CoA carboxylase biotin carboxyl carrier protein [Bacillota bacterium]
MERNELLETVKALTDQVNNGGLDELEVETDDFRIRLSKKPPMPPFPPVANMPVGEVNIAPKAEKKEAPKTEGKIIKSPIIGTFYASAAPGKPPFVSVGSQVKKGGVVCIVESMKLMNEITSEFDGTVAEIYVSDAQSVEYDQPLFRLD